MGKLTEKQSKALEEIKHFFISEIPVKLIKKDFVIISRIAEMTDYNPELVIQAWEYMKENEKFFNRLSLETLVRNIQAITMELKRSGRLKLIRTIKEKENTHSSYYYLFKNVIPKSEWGNYKDLWNKMKQEEKEELSNV